MNLQNYSAKLNDKIVVDPNIYLDCVELNHIKTTYYSILVSIKVVFLFFNFIKF